MQGTCTIFFYDGYVSIAPTVIGLSQLLEASGYTVKIYATRTNQTKTPQPDIIGKNIKIRYFKNLELFNKFKVTWLGNFITIGRVVNFAFRCLLEKSGAGNINIAVDMYGAIAALLNFYVFQEPFLFVSLEIDNYEKQYTRLSKLFVPLLNLAYRKADAVIIQDQDRFKILSEYCKYKHNKVFFLPNSPLVSSQQLSDLYLNNLFREKFNLSQTEFPCIALQAGMINEDVYGTTLVRTFAQLNNGCALVLHGFVNEENTIRKTSNEEYIKLLQQLNSQNLFLSLELLPYDQVDRIFSAATIGLAFYQNINENFSIISMASGKLAQYLKHGKPILMSYSPSSAVLMEKYKFGIMINNPANVAEVKLAIEQILKDYNTYSQNARLCFDEEFNFHKKAQPILAFMQQYISTK